MTVDDPEPPEAHVGQWYTMPYRVEPQHSAVLPELTVAQP